MKLTRLQVKGFQGLEQLDTDLSTGITVLEGPNGAGKTSVLDAVRVALTNKCTRSALVHTDSENGLVLFELDNGYSGVRNVQNGGRTAGELKLYDQGAQVSRAQAFLNSLGLGFGFNPLDFIELRPDLQTKKVLEILPIPLTRAQLIAITGYAVEGVDYTKHPLEVLSNIESALIEDRRVIGRNKRDMEGMAAKLHKQVPVGFDADAVRDFDIAEASKEIRDIQSQEVVVSNLKHRINLIDADINSLTAQLERAKKDKQQHEASLIKAQQKVTEIPEGRQAQLRDAIESYQGNAKILAKQEQAQDCDAQVTDLKREYVNLSDMIETVRAKPAEIIAQTDLPLAGLGIEDGKITINGLPLSELSTGEQLKVAVDLAIAMLGDLRVVLIDGFERLDKANQDEIIEHLTAADVQAIIAQVGGTEDNELSILLLDDDGEKYKNEADIPF